MKNKEPKPMKIRAKITAYFLIFSTVCFLLFIPSVYVISKIRYEENLEVLFQDKLNLFSKDILPHLKSREDITKFNQLNDGIQILPYDSLKFFHITSNFYSEKHDNHWVNHCEMRAPIVIANQAYIYYYHHHGATSKSFVEQTVWLVIMTLIILFFGLLVINNFFSTKLLKTLRIIFDLIRNFKIEDSQQPPTFPKSELKEINEFISILNKTMQGNIHTHINQKEFVENAAHELQTPISILQAHVNLLTQDPQISESQLNIIASIQKNISRMNRLNRNLLLLSKLDHNSYKQTQEIELNQTIQEHLPFFQEQALKKSITLSVEEQGKLIIHSNLTLVEVLVRNLLMNAIRHNISQGNIHILIGQQSLCISNSGELQDLQEEKMWNRFHKSNVADTGTGLGLSLIKKICQVNNWRLQYRYQNEQHHFEISLNQKQPQS